MPFTNEAERGQWREYMRQSQYGFKKPPRLLFQWSRLFQAVVSQAGTYLLTGKFHGSECGIYKAEGGCRIQGVGELVLAEHCCYFDYGGKELGEKENRLAELITAIVFAWNPNEPIESMLAAAATDAGCEIEALRKAVESASCGGVFGGDALSSFFGWNPFSDPPVDREYKRWCLVKFSGKTDAEVDQMYADQDLGKQLEERLREAVRTSTQDHHHIYCCSPKRIGGTLQFWVNTGRQTQLDGWHTQSFLEKWLKSKEMLEDKATY